MHPGHLALYARMLLDYVSEKGRQVVLSTHSIELIDYVLELAEQRSALEKVSVVLLRRYVDRIELEVHPGPRALQSRREVYEELRGL